MNLIIKSYFAHFKKHTIEGFDPFDALRIYLNVSYLRPLIYVNRQKMKTISLLIKHSIVILL